MKKYILSFSLIIVFAFYVLFTKNNTTSIDASLNPPAVTSSNTPSTSVAITPAPSPSPTPTPSPSPTPTPAGQYKDGSYTGPVADAFYGSLQTTAVIQGGKLVDVQFPQYPNDRGHTQEVSAQALPMLKQEAIQAQSANVNVVSGATDTSLAFQQSLGAALATAKN